MKTIRRILQWTAGILCGMYILLQVSMFIPKVQQLTASAAANAMHDQWGWDISIGKARLSIEFRLILDEVILNDKQGKRMLHISRIAAKPDLLGIMQGHISISNAQLFGTQALLYQKTPDSKPNFQFILDTFKSKEKAKKSTDLHIGTIIIRRLAIQWDRQWMPCKNPHILDPNHLSLNDITLTANLQRISKDTCDITVRRCSFKEGSGFEINNLSFLFKAGATRCNLSDMHLTLPHSNMYIPSLQATYNTLPKAGFRQWIQNVTWNTSMDMNLATSDIAPLGITYKQIPSNIGLHIQADGHNAQANVRTLNIFTKDGTARLQASARIENLSGEPSAQVNVQKFHVGRQWTESLPLNLGIADAKGTLQLSRKRMTADLAISTDNGSATVKGELLDMNHLNATLQTKGLNVAKTLQPTLGTFPIGQIAATAKVNGDIKAQDGKPDLSIQLDAPLITLLGYEYHNLQANAHISSTQTSLKTDVSDINGTLQADLLWKHHTLQQLQGHIHTADLAADRLGLFNHYAGTRTTADIDLLLKGKSLKDISGYINISGLTIQTYNRDSILTGPLNAYISTDISGGIRNTIIQSEPIRLTAIGQYDFASLPATAMHLAHQAMPGIASTTSGTTNDILSFDLLVQDSTLLSTLLKTKISIPEESQISGIINGRMGTAYLWMHLPQMSLAGKRFETTSLELNHKASRTDMQFSTTLCGRKSRLPIALNSNTQNGIVSTQVSLNAQATRGTHGTIDIRTTFPKNPDGTRAINAWIAPSQFSIGDSLWEIRPAALSWNQGTLSIKGMDITQGKSHRLHIDGSMSKSEEDTLNVEFKRISVDYVMDLVNFHAVEFGGEASGTAKASGLIGNPYLDADVTMQHFMFNNADQGKLNGHVNWGDDPHHLTIDAHISDAGNGENTDVRGWIRLGDSKLPNAIDLDIDAGNFNLAFLNDLTSGILNNIQGRTQGYVRVFGPLGAVDLEGDLKISQARLFVPTIGVEYTLHNDSVHLTPGRIAFDTHPQDQYGHQAKVTGHLAHNSFKNMSYRFLIQADNLLCYDYPDITNSSFGAHVLATGQTTIQGHEGALSINMNLTPNAGTSMTYNISSPDALNDAEFIHYRQTSTADTTQDSRGKDDNGIFSHIKSDLNLNFNIAATPDAKIRFLLDKRTGDMIEIQGNGQLTAQYSNKKAFQIFGTYKVQDGQYNINIQDVIRKNFRFQNDGTITFSGDPLQAELNLYAIHTVTGVSLNDLTTRSLGLAKTNVNCIMHLTGKPQQPQLSFDFDLPNATEDERQIIRAVVRTEEERNLQAIYLLGLNRFYSYSTNATGSSQGSMAMNSLVSSTLSSHINSLISSAVGNSKWNFGANLQTGEDGWKNMDVEGQLSGSLFNDRLQLTGNFGYREKYYTQRNFISDVDVQYMLTKNGSISLKAYNQANDRYFVQSSLNTQGLGIQFKKSFNRIRDIFKKKSSRKNNK